MTGWMLASREKAATEQSRGESASAQGWSTNNKKGKSLCGGGRGAPNGWDCALGMLMRQGTFCLFPSSE